MKPVVTGGGWPAVKYTFRKAREVGGLWKLWKAMRSRNACKTCALGMGGQKGGMVNEVGGFPEVCKKSLQAMVSDMQGAIKPEFFSTYSIPQLQSFSPRELEHCGRLTTPLVLERGSQYYRAIGWDDAFGRIVAKIKSLAPDETFWYSSGRSSNEAAFLMQLFARLLGTNNINNCSYYCHQASGVGLGNTLGTGTATVQLEDVEDADLVFVIGGNPASNHPRLMTTLRAVRKRGGKVVAINPVVETGMVNFSVPSRPMSLLFGSKIASHYIQPNIGGDLALLSGIAKRIVEMRATDEPFLRDHCTGWDALQAKLDTFTWDDIVAKSGVSKDEIDMLARLYAESKATVFSWTMGITHHLHGVENVEAIANLALIRGMVGKPHCGLLPIRGHSNVQGIGSVGVTPQLKKAVFERLEANYQVKLPTGPGLDTMACMERTHEGALKFGLAMGGNLYGSNPDATYAAEALRKLDTLVYLNTTLNTGHAHGLAGGETIILPVLARDEEPQPTTQESMFSYVRMSDGGPRRHEGPMSEIEIMARLGRAILGETGPVNWRNLEDTRSIRRMIATVIPGFEQMATMDEKKTEFYITGRAFHAAKFPTADGRAHLQTYDLPDTNGHGDELRLMTCRSEGQFNTVVYEDYDLYRNQTRRDIIFMNEADVERLGLYEDQPVTVRSECGVMHNILVRPYAIKAGNVMMYYPEANVLVPRHLDPRSKTPAFKSVAVKVEAQVPQSTLAVV